MKAVTIVFNIAVEDELRELLARCGVGHFTLWPRLQGVGRGTGPRMDNHVWPGANAAVLAVLGDAAAHALMDALQELRASPTGRQAGIQAFLSPVERMLEG